MNFNRVMLAIAGAGLLALPVAAEAAGTTSSNSSVRSVRLVLAAPRAATLQINGGTNQNPANFTPPSRFVDPRIVPGNGLILRIPRHGPPRSRGWRRFT